MRKVIVENIVPLAKSLDFVQFRCRGRLCVYPMLAFAFDSVEAESPH
jgi:hypothetical protein